ncbi:MAG: hypothetical protein WCC17_24405 [Candidatus Nitrosopolaris sp.]
MPNQHTHFLKPLYHISAQRWWCLLQMVKISIQAAHEQVNPRDLLNDVVGMDEHGIERCWTSDHYMPWWDSGACGGY